MSDDAFKRRFYEDRAELTALGIAIAADGGEGGEAELYSLPASAYYLPAIELTPAELSALAACLFVLEDRFAYSEPLRLALLSLTHGRPELLAPAAPTPISVLPEREARRAAGALPKLQQAVAAGKTVTFLYYSIGRDEERERTVDPYGLLLVGDEWYLVGFCHLRTAIRTFRLSRLRSRVTFATRAPHDFGAPLDFSIDRYLDRPPWQLGEPVGHAVVRVAAGMAWWVEAHFARCGTIAPAGDDARLNAGEGGRDAGTGGSDGSGAGGDGGDAARAAPATRPTSCSRPPTTRLSCSRCSRWGGGRARRAAGAARRAARPARPPGRRSAAAARGRPRRRAARRRRARRARQLAHSPRRLGTGRRRRRLAGRSRPLHPPDHAAHLFARRLPGGRRRRRDARARRRALRPARHHAGRAARRRAAPQPRQLRRRGHPRVGRDQGAGPGRHLRRGELGVRAAGPPVAATGRHAAAGRRGARRAAPDRARRRAAQRGAEAAPRPSRGAVVGRRRRAAAHRRADPRRGERGRRRAPSARHRVLVGGQRHDHDADG